MALQTTTIGEFTFSFVNQREFSSLYDEIFIAKQYEFSAATETPFILDCGANMGMSVVYFKQLYPRARIIAFEPNPATFRLLTINVRQNNLTGVRLVNAALAGSAGEIDFYVSNDRISPTTVFDTGVKNAWCGPGEWRTITVPTITLSSCMNGQVDLLKLDIEGMEEVVLREIEGRLNDIDAIKMEYHHFTTKNIISSLDVILSILEQGKFNYAIEWNNKMVSLQEIRQLSSSEQHVMMIDARKVSPSN